MLLCGGCILLGLGGIPSAASRPSMAATQAIVRNVAQAARGTEQVTGNITSVARAAEETGSASAQVLASASDLAN